MTFSTWILFVFFVLFSVLCNNIKYVGSSRVKDDQDFSLRTGDTCRTETVIAIALGAFCCLGAIVILLMIFFILKRYSQIKEYKQMVDMLIEGGAVFGEDVQQQKMKPEWSISSNGVRKISPLSPAKNGSQAKIRKRQTKEKDRTISSRNTKNDTHKKTPTSPLKNRSQVEKAVKTGGSVSGRKSIGKSPKKSAVPQFVVLPGATTVKSDGLGNLGSATRRSMSAFPSQTSDSTSSPVTKQE